MRLGISTLLVVALASASLVACGDETTGSGGGGGAGGGAGTGGDDTVAGTGGETAGTGGAGGGGDNECTPVVVADAAECDPGCNQNVTNADTGAVMCTIACTEDLDCSADGTVVCAEDALGNTACLFDCSGANVCPGNDYVCDQAVLVCLPDEASE